MIKGFILATLFFIICKYSKLQKNYISQREDFLKILQHDLRVSSLAQIRGLELLKKSENLSNTEIFSELENSSRYTLEMINMLLVSYGFENQENFFKKENISFTNLINNIYRELEPQANEKNIKLTVVYKKQNLLYADKASLHRLFKNLIQSAITHSKENSQIITSLSFHNQTAHLAINFANKSPNRNGLNSTFSPHQRFTIVGQNIKMLLSKKIVDSYKGQIWVDTSKKERNVYNIILPKSKEKFSQRKRSKAIFNRNNLLGQILIPLE